jgi:hypothetical protein
MIAASRREVAALRVFDITQQTHKAENITARISVDRDRLL